MSVRLSSQTVLGGVGVNWLSVGEKVNEVVQV